MGKGLTRSAILARELASIFFTVYTQSFVQDRNAAVRRFRDFVLQNQPGTEVHRIDVWAIE